METLERAQNKAFRIITGSVKTTLVAALQLYTANNSIFYAVMDPAVGTYVKMKDSGRADWMLNFEKTCERILEELGVKENNILFYICQPFINCVRQLSDFIQITSQQRCEVNPRDAT